jgi:hypothetical protein
VDVHQFQYRNTTVRGTSATHRDEHATIIADVVKLLSACWILWGNETATWGLLCKAGAINLQIWSFQECEKGASSEQKPGTTSERFRAAPVGEG